MAVTLTWQGPVGPGLFPTDTLAFERLCVAGVYLRVKQYAGGRSIAYAGQSVALLARFDQHLAAMLSLAAPLRDADGRVAFHGEAAERLVAYGDMAAMAALAAADAARTRFWFAPCDAYFHEEHLSLAEGLLQRRLIERVAGEIGGVENVVAAPGRRPDDVPDRWENDLSGLDAEGRDLLLRLLGDAPMTLP